MEKDGNIWKKKGTYKMKRKNHKKEKEKKEKGQKVRKDTKQETCDSKTLKN